jgi:catalase
MNTRRAPATLPVLTALAAALLTAQPAVAQVDPTRTLDQFESTFGKFAGFRRSGAKGVCATGEFTGSAEARALSTASAFSGRPVPVIARFSVGGANPGAPDNARTQRNMALQFDLPGGEQWQMGNISAPVFGAATPEQFLGRLASLQPDPATKAPDPNKVKAFADANPEVLLQGRYFASQPVPASFGTVNYWGVHGFGFTNSRGEKQFGKWIFEPVGGVKTLTDDEAKAKGPNFLFADLRERVAAGGVAFDFNLQLAQPGDRVDSAVVPLPDDRRKVNLGRLVIKSVSPDATGPCVNITYIPTVLPKGVEPTADPMLAGRAAPYAVGLGRRLGEGAKQ